MGTFHHLPSATIIWLAQIAFPASYFERLNPGKKMRRGFGTLGVQSDIMRKGVEKKEREVSLSRLKQPCEGNLDLLDRTAHPQKCFTPYQKEPPLPPQEKERASISSV